MRYFISILMILCTLIHPALKAARSYDILIAGGDAMIGRWQHDLAALNGYQWPLEKVSGIIRSGDAAICNLETCISLAGKENDKGEKSPYYYRARPQMLDILISAGIDIVNCANNHTGDYGIEGMIQTMQWTSKAGLVNTGIGKDIAQAQSARYIMIGNTKAAIVGIDTTMPYFRATALRPGTFYQDTAHDPGLVTFRDRIKRLRRLTKNRCDMLILTIHWGANWTDQTPELHRKMARIAFENGVDLILGHSSHQLHGIEIIKGKPVIYDMGQLLFDIQPMKISGRYSALFRLYISPEGTHRIEALPIRIREGYTEPASEKESLVILRDLIMQCTAMDTRMTIEKTGRGKFIGVINIRNPRISPKNKTREDTVFITLDSSSKFDIPRADEMIVSELPKDCISLEKPAELAPGLFILGYRTPREVSQDSLLNIETWWKIKKKPGKNWKISFQLDNKNYFRMGQPWYTRHDPGNWALPLSDTDPGEIVKDLYPARLKRLPAGEIEIKVMITDSGSAERGRPVGSVYRIGNVTIAPGQKENGKRD